MKTWKSSLIEFPWKRVENIVAAVLLLVGGMLLQACGGGSTVLPSLVAIKITPATTLLPLAGQRQLIATGVYSDGTQLDITDQVTWSVSSTEVSTTPVSVNAGGLVNGVSLGSSVVSASVGPTVGVIQLTVATNGYSSSNVGILAVPLKKGIVDVGYEPISQFAGPGGLYDVQAINLDADLTSSVVPVQTALVASIPMPQGFVPNAVAASQRSLKVAVISYSSPKVVIIDASNDSTDFLSNTVVANYSAPLTKMVAFNGKQCMICAAVVNPLTDQLILSTAQGYYSMDLSSGVFTQLPFAPTAVPAPSFVLNPVAADPYIVSPSYGQDPSVPSEVQILDLKTNVVTTNPGFGLTAPNAAVVDVFTNNAVVLDDGANGQSLVNLASPVQPVPTPVPNLSTCASSGPSPIRFNMVSLAIGVSANVSNNPHTLLLGEASGSCVGFEIWPPLAASGAPDPTQFGYGFGVMPVTPDGNPFQNGADPNAIAAFTSVVDRRSYGLLLDSTQKWVAKIDLGLVTAVGFAAPAFPLPTGRDLENSGALLAGFAGAPVIYLPTTGTFSLSANNIDFGNQPVGAASVPSSIILTNAGATSAMPQIAVQGANASDFAQSNDCSNNIPAGGTCTITIIFTPGAQGPRTASLTVDGGGGQTLTVALKGNGT